MSLPPSPLALFLCDFTGIGAEPWAAAGYECWCVDLQHRAGVGPLIDGIRRVGADVTRWCPPLCRRIAFIACWPDCTNTAVSGARWFESKGPDALADSLRLWGACLRICRAAQSEDPGIRTPWIAENPVSTIWSYVGKPAHYFDPCDYAGYLADPAPEAYTKKTGILCGGGFVMPPPRPVHPMLGSKMHLLPPSPDRANLRSATPRGFSRAVFLANGGGTAIREVA